MTSDASARPAPGVVGDPASTDEAGEFLALLHAALRRVRREASERAQPAGTTPGQYRMLRFLARCDEPCRLGAVASALDVAPRSVTSKVDDAEQAGLVRRTPDPHDRRATLVELTPRGREVVAQVGAERSSSAGTLLARLDAAERAELLRLLRAVAGERQDDARDGDRPADGAGEPRGAHG
ncbi:MarR family winged helix-turn-helix transcriptional regulator [Cellulosimicrobium cellulans]|uniref:MarR family winged helix-turn-helix transcriptional regulator n=1 Tax=Cellulosimicrobium cellulans TaxID=1710 RepID=UPI00114128AA|nr:MarR family winged helix-turn-helix transcriptional regulator [Cellulosimicrobium cellulans]